ncbi:MAG: regulator [Gammaproteobacteria bacterium]|nr:regulator [Gammaproteobacteria bacterium]MCF6258787.1 regulator [Gammaproteobacteria bacterium]
MNISSKGLAVAVLVVGGLIVAAYNFGSKQEQAAPSSAASSAPPLAGATEMPPGHPATTETSGIPAVNLLPDQPASGAKFSHFRVGQRNVKGMLADGDKVWVGTSGGVIRYDLKTDDYKLYDVKNQSLISNGVFHVSKLRGKIMVGTYGGGLSVYTPETDQWQNYNIPDGLADQFVYDIVEAKNGDYWIATWSGVNRVPNGDFSDTSKWETFTVENTQGGLPNDWVYSVAVGKDGDIWFATEGGLALYRNKQWTNWQHDAGLGAPYEKVKDDVAFSNDPAESSKHHAQQKAEQGLSDIKVGYNPNYIISMIVDEDGVVWAGTWGAGLSRFDGKTWKTYTVKEGLPGNHIFMLHKSPGGEMWIGTNKGLARPNANENGFKVMTKADGLFANNVFSLAEASDGSLWVGSFGGVARITDYN